MRSARMFGALASLFLLAAPLLHLAFITHVNSPLLPMWLWARKWSVLGVVYLAAGICSGILLYFAFENLHKFGIQEMFIKFRRIAMAFAILLCAGYGYFALGWTQIWLVPITIALYLCVAWIRLWSGFVSQSLIFRVYSLASAVVFGLFLLLAIAIAANKYFLLYLLFLGEFSCVMILVWLNLIMLFGWLGLKPIK